MKRIFSFLTLCLCTLYAAQASHFNASNSRVLRATDAGLVLQNDHLYYMEGASLEIQSTERGQSGLRVAENAIVFIYVGNDQHLVVRGGDAEGTSPAGAGIEVPESSTLYLLGTGWVECYGGKSGEGVAGLAGEKGVVNDGSLFSTKHYHSGRGGNGGNGGGGAGAGIGGRGGQGGRGGVGGESVELEQSGTNKKEGNAGGVGGNSESGANCGKVYVVGNITVNAFSGERHTRQHVPAFGPSSVNQRGYLFTNTFVAGSGGAGGAGNNGLAAMKIGGGGPGAAGAGAGASGSLAGVYRMNVGDLYSKAVTFLLGKAVDAVIAVVTHDPMHAIAVFNIPGTETSLRFTAGNVISIISDWIIAQFQSPLQTNGGGGLGSFTGACSAKQVDGLGLHIERFTYSNIFGSSVEVYCPNGGNAGAFGQPGSLLLAKRSWMSNVNQDMPVFQADEYPEELLAVLTFDLHFDTTGVDISHAHAADRQIVYGDTLPAVVPVPEAKHASQVFAGYVDQQNILRYDRLGHVMPTCKDTTGQDVHTYNYPGDMVLTPRWSNYTYILVRHHLETPAKPVMADAEHEYGATDYQLIPRIGAQTYTVYARNYANYLKHDNKTEESVTIAVGDTLKVVDFYYDKMQYVLNWMMPANTKMLGEHTSAGALRVGEQIRTAAFALDTVTGGYYHIDGWHYASETDPVRVDTMPDHAVAFAPILRPLAANVTFDNDEDNGTVSFVANQLGTHMQFTVTPNEGWLVDSCDVLAFSYRGYRSIQTVQENNRFAFYANPEDDSIAVRVHYLGVPHALSYTEASGIRQASMTLWVNGDSVSNDGGLDIRQTVRQGDYVMVRPERAENNEVAKQVEVKTVSGTVVPVEFVEQYNGHDQYEYYYTFTMPNEDVRVEADYGLLNDHLVKLRVVCDEGPDSVQVWSNRGLLLNSQTLMTTGYMVDAEQQVWLHIALEGDIDSIRLRYKEQDGSYSYHEVDRHMYVYTNPVDTVVKDTTVAPVVCLRHMFRMPAAAQEVLLEIKHKNNDYVFEGEETDLRQMSEIEDGRIYNMMGVYMGTNPALLGRGVYIRNGKKFTK